MAARRVELGPVGKVVADNIKAIRGRHGLTLRDLSEKMTEVGWPMANNTISEIENGGRRCDVDDLVALSHALNCSPLELLGDDSGDVVVTPQSAVLSYLLDQVERERAAMQVGKRNVKKVHRGNH